LEAEATVKRRILVQGISTLYLEAGDGPVILLVHGNSAGPHSWQPLMRELALTHRVVALGLPGYGVTSPVEGVLPSRLVSFVEAFLDALGVDEIIAVGHSYGGLVTAEFALTHPHRVTRLVLADSAGLGRAVNPALIATALTPRAIAELWATVLLLPGSAIARVLTTGLQLRQPWQVSLREWVNQARISRSRTLLRTAFEVLHEGIGLSGQRVRVSDRLKEIEVPTLIIWGLTDEIFPLWQAMRAVRRLPAGQLAVLSGAGHMSYLDSHEEFIDALGPFVRDDIQVVRNRMRHVQ
jgi:pimeloyl-ACP methyl ester carboxylesterase